MGGAIAQEFTRQFPHRVAGLILCATMCGGPRATYAERSVVRVMRDLDGYSPEQIARRIWDVTYAPSHLRENREQAEDQMRRETALPTPLHAADLQFQAFVEFDGSKALSQIRCPTLILTGDRDRLIRPQNSKMLAQLIPGSKLVVIPGGGHRVLWEAEKECTHLIKGFLASIGHPVVVRDADDSEQVAATAGKGLWPWMTSRTALVFAVLYLAVSLIIALSWSVKPPENLVPQSLAKLVYLVDKSNLDPLRLLHFFALAILAVWLVPRDWRGLTTPVMRGAIRCGENSLAIYCLGVLLALASHIALVDISDGLAMQIALCLAGILMMIVAATLLSSIRTKPRQQQPLLTSDFITADAQRARLRSGDQTADVARDAKRTRCVPPLPAEPRWSKPLNNDRRDHAGHLTRKICHTRNVRILRPARDFQQGRLKNPWRCRMSVLACMTDPALLNATGWRDHSQPVAKSV
jgi:esterase/lipase